MPKSFDGMFDKLSNFIDSLYENEWLHWIFIGILVIFMIMLVFGSSLKFK